MSYLNTKSIATVTSTSVFPKANVIVFGSGATAMTGTIPTSTMFVGEVIIIKRNIGATGTLTVRGQSGSIQAQNNVLSATTTIGAANTFSQNVTFIWDGTNLLRIG